MSGLENIFRLSLVLLALAAHSRAGSSVSVLRVAMLDFTAEDNSYPSSRAAADFTGALQAQLAGQPGVEWVERAQLNKAGQELALGGFNRSDAAAVRSGKWLKADLLVLGRFLPSETEGWSLALDVLELDHAEVLVKRTLKFPGSGGTPLRSLVPQVQAAAGLISELLSLARVKRAEFEGRIAIAPLFFSPVGDLSRSDFRTEFNLVSEHFFEVLDEAVSRNSRLRLVRFPRALRSLEESEMSFNGLVDVDPDAWQRVADVYVWGTFFRTNVGRAQASWRLETTLSIWDGHRQPKVIRESLSYGGGSALPAKEASHLLEGLVKQAIAFAEQRAPAAPSDTLRQQVAASIVHAALPMENDWERKVASSTFFLDLPHGNTSAEVVQMLETACFLDPNNRLAQEELIRCRWGDWVRFGRMRSPFWTNWRLAEAWGKYVERFGFQPGRETNSALKYMDIPGPYVSPLRSLLDMWGIYNRVQAYGFPKDMPESVELEWKRTVQTEYANRLEKIISYAKDGNFVTNQFGRSAGQIGTSLGNLLLTIAGHSPMPVPKRLQLIEELWPQYARYANLAKSVWPFNNVQPAVARLYAQAGRPGQETQLLALKISRPARAAPQAAGAVSSTTNLLSPRGRPAGAIFYLPLLKAPPPELYPRVDVVKFGREAQVYRLDQLAFAGNRLWIVATDVNPEERKGSPELAAEILSKTSRLWSYEPASRQLALDQRLLGKRVNTILPQDKTLWVAGDTLGAFDLESEILKHIDLRSGLAMHNAAALAEAGGRLFIAGDFVQLFVQDSDSLWKRLEVQPNGPRSTGTGNPPRLVGSGKYLLLLAGTPFLYDTSANLWTNLNTLLRNEWAGSTSGFMAVAPDTNDGFWLGIDEGFFHVDAQKLTVRSWLGQSKDSEFNMPTPINRGMAFPGLPISSSETQISRQFKRLSETRAAVHLWKEKHGEAINPAVRPSRLPGRITALLNDGEFLWVATEYPQTTVEIFHKPSESWLGFFKVPRPVSAMAATADYLWVGLSGELLQVEKAELLATPRSNWVPDKISDTELARIISALPLRDRAVYSFLAGDYDKVVTLLEGADPARADLETLFLLGFSCDSLGLNVPDLSQKYFQAISDREPDSAWGKAARTAMRENGGRLREVQRSAALLKKYDVNKDGILDEAEKKTMLRDPEYQQEEKIIVRDAGIFQLEQIIQRYDSDGDGKLNSQELDALYKRVQYYEKAGAQNSPKTFLLTPLLSQGLLPAKVMLERFDQNKDGKLDAAEFQLIFDRHGASR